MCSRFALRLQRHHRLVARRNDIAHGLAQIGAHGIQIQFRVDQPQVPKEDTVEVIIVVLAGVNHYRIKVLPALLYDRS